MINCESIGQIRKNIGDTFDTNSFILIPNEPHCLYTYSCNMLDDNIYVIVTVILRNMILFYTSSTLEYCNNY